MIRWLSVSLRRGRALSFHKTCQVKCKGKSATRWIFSAPVALTRKAKPKRDDPDGQRIAPIPGAPLAPRLVVSRLHDARGQVLAEWYLLRDPPDTVSDAKIAPWHDFRWRIESFFKRLKQAGRPLERWERESGGAFLQAIAEKQPTPAFLPGCLARERGEAARQTQDFLARLSGRQMKPSRPATLFTRLEGVFMLFAMLDPLEHYSTRQLRTFASSVLQERQYAGGKWGRGYSCPQGKESGGLRRLFHGLSMTELLYCVSSDDIPRCRRLRIESKLS
jgi:hypothetical protein